MFVFAWAISDPRFRDAEGSLTGSFCLPLSTSSAFVLLGWTFAGELRKFGSWLALALVGQAMALQLIDAGKIMRYQHYEPLGRSLIENHPLILTFLLAQSLIVLYSLARRWRVLGDWISSRFKIWQIVGAAVIFSIFSATVSHQVPVYISELVVAAYLQAINLLTIIFVVWALPENSLALWKIKLERFFGAADQEGVVGSPRVDRFAIIAAVWVFILAAGFSFFSYQRHPHIPDEVVYIYQARYLADGVLAMPAPLVKDAFDVYLMQFSGSQWYPTPPVGWPAMLSLGVLAGAPWLVNPLLGGFNILLIYLILSELYSRRLARIAVFLCCVSPWYIFMAMNFMTHTFTLTCALGAVLYLLWARKSGKARWAWFSGLALGVMSLIRPLEGLTWAVLLGLWAIGIGGKRLKFVSIIGLVFSTMLVSGLVFPYNKTLTGSATSFPINVYTDQRFGKNSNAYGFGPDRGMGWPLDPNPGHSPVDAMINADLNSFSINIELFGWSTGSLLLIALLLLSGSYKKSDYLMMAVIAAIFWVFFFYYFSGGPDFGARYWYLMYVPLVALTVRGIQYLEEKFKAASTVSFLAGTRVMVAVLILSGLVLVNYFPWRAIDKYYHYLDMRPDIPALAKEYGFGKSLVLIRGDAHPDYASAAVYNPVDLNSDAPIYAWDRSPLVQTEVVKAYADRPIWIIDGPTVTHKGYEVIAGPLSAEQVLSSEAP
jgi:hypothetical protein